MHTLKRVSSNRRHIRWDDKTNKTRHNFQSQIKEEGIAAAPYGAFRGGRLISEMSILQLCYDIEHTTSDGIRRDERMYINCFNRQMYRNLLFL